MKKNALLIALLISAVGLAACPKKKEEASTTTTTTTVTTPSGAESKTEVKTTDATGETIGVAECDAYISKYTKCIMDKVPEGMRGTMKQTLDQSLQAWKQAASTPEGKTALASACQTAIDTAKQSMGSFGCEW